MKKSVIILSSVLFLAACTNNQGTATEDTTNTAQTEQVAEEPQPAFELTDKGVEPILLGMKTKDVPQSVDGLYDKVTKAKEYLDFGFVETILTFTRDGKKVMTASAYNIGNDRIAEIRVFDTENIKVEKINGDGFAYVMDGDLLPKYPDEPEYDI